MATLAEAYRTLVHELPGFTEEYTLYSINLDGTANGLVLFGGLARWWQDFDGTLDAPCWAKANALIARLLDELAVERSSRFEAAAVDDFFEELAQQPVAFRRFMDYNELSENVRAIASWYTPP